MEVLSTLEQVKWFASVEVKLALMNGLRRTLIQSFNTILEKFNTFSGFMNHQEK